MTSPLRTTSNIAQHSKSNIGYYEPKPMAVQCSGDDMNEYDHHVLIHSNLSQERNEQLNRSNSQNSTPKKSHYDQSQDGGPKTPSAFNFGRKLGDISGNDSANNLSSSACRYNKQNNFPGDKGPKPDSIENLSEASDDQRKGQISDIDRDCSVNTDGEMLEMLNAEPSIHDFILFFLILSVTGRKYLGENKEMYRLDLSAITVKQEKTIDLSRKEFKTFIYESANRNFLENTEYAQQKLDFSMICQQISSYIYVVGGFIDNGSCNVEKYDIQKGKWDIAGNLLNNRTKFSAVVLPNENILILGGKQVIFSFI